jgi:hypothetical protein
MGAHELEEKQELVPSVLMPWRSQKMRRIAEKHAQQDFGKDITLLRTHYAGGAADDARFSEWLEEIDYNEEYSKDDMWWYILDDPDLFDMGSNEWHAVYDVLPELAAKAPDRSFTQNDIKDAREVVEDKREAGHEVDEFDYQEAIMRTASYGHNFLLVLDKEAFDDGELLLVHRDKKGNVIRQATIEPSNVELLMMYVNGRGTFRESEYWDGIEDGKRYKWRGGIMRNLIPIVMGKDAP